jgi:hypothetical protein
MISNLKSADIEIWGMVVEVHSVGPRRTSPRIMSHDHGKLASAVSNGVYHNFFVQVGPTQIINGGI